MEQTKNEGLVAREMGNSPKVVKEHCFEIVDERAAKEYWSIKPLPLLRHVLRNSNRERDGDDGGGLGPW
jgi:hypothetical protein